MDPQQKIHDEIFARSLSRGSRAGFGFQDGGKKASGEEEEDDASSSTQDHLKRKRADEAEDEGVARAAFSKEAHVEDGAEGEEGDDSEKYEKRHQVRSHYDGHAFSETIDFKKAQVERWTDRTYPLKHFHNEVKRRMIMRFSTYAERHLDIACGRGGDLNKWFDVRIKHVHGVDISEHEVAEARQRLQELIQRRKLRSLNYTFEARDDVGVRPIPWTSEYNTVSCMFSGHYFFATESTAKNFLQNVSVALVDGGIFYGTIACGKRVLSLLRGKDSYKSDMLSVSRTWPGSFDSFKNFGSGYTFAILQTVTNDDSKGQDLGLGCEEYLVFFSAFTQIAALYHLFPLRDFDWEFVDPKKGPPPKPLFENHNADKKYVGFRHFDPSYDLSTDDGKELDKISRLYAGFVFRKELQSPCVPGCKIHQHPVPESAAAAAAAPASNP